MSKMQLEIDFLDTGTGSGDAICFRYGDFDNDDFKVIIIDSGYKNTGEKLADFIEKRYNTKKVDLAICTHSDQDHASGFPTILDRLDVTKIWINLPGDFSEDLIQYAEDKRMTINSLENDLAKTYPYVYNILKASKRNKTSIYKLMRGRKFDNDTLRVLSPTEGFYKDLLIKSEKTRLKKYSEFVSEGKEEKTLGGETGAENEMSGVVLFEIANKKYLFTGDAGLIALNKTIEYCESQDISLDDLTWLQVPHHGSRKNIDENILTKIKAKVAFISAAKDDEHHPSHLVLNALDENGFTIYTTEGNSLSHSFNGSNRPDYSKATPKNKKNVG